MIIACPTLNETKKLGRALGTVLGDGDVVLLDGDPARRPLLRKLQKHWAWTDGTYQVPRFLS